MGWPAQVTGAGKEGRGWAAASSTLNALAKGLLALALPCSACPAFRPCWCGTRPCRCRLRGRSAVSAPRSSVPPPLGRQAPRVDTVSSDRAVALAARLSKSGAKVSCGGGVARKGFLVPVWHMCMYCHNTVGVSHVSG